MAKSKKKADTSLAAALRVPQKEVRVADFDPRATPKYPGEGKLDAPLLIEAMSEELSTLQEQLYATGRENPETARSVLLILQGLDTSGKGGVIRHAVGMVDPQGVQLKAFKAPTATEKRRGYLWRIRREAPAPGMIGVFDRSQYEDVLVPNVTGTPHESVWMKRFDEINAFEKELTDAGTVILKCFLNVSYAEQGKRLAERLASPDKYWKYNPGDIDTREQWPTYMEAYAEVLNKCNTEHAPWYVIPADRKWYRNWAVARLLLEQLRALDLSWPEADFDIAAEKQRLKGS